MKWLLKIFRKSLKSIVLDIVGNVVRETVGEILERVQIPVGKGKVKLSTLTIDAIAVEVEKKVEQIVEDRLNDL